MGLKRNVLTHCNWSDADEFKASIYKSDVQAVLANYTRFAQRVYMIYRGKDDESQKRRNKEPYQGMRADVWVDVISDLHIIDSVFTQDAVRQIFLKMQDAEGDGALLAYHEFLECLCAVAVFKNPTPYVPLFQRISRFFENWFVAGMESQVGTKWFNKKESKKKAGGDEGAGLFNKADGGEPKRSETNNKGNFFN